MNPSLNAVSVDPFDPVQNPLGTKGLLAGFLSSATAITQGKAYAELIATQGVLDISSVDIGLAVKMAQFQQQLRDQARDFLDIILRGFSRLVLEGGSLASLIETFDQLDSTDIRKSWSDAGKRQNLVNVLSAVSEQAGEWYVDVNTFVTDVELASEALGTLSDNVDAVLGAALSELTDALKATAQTINDLTKAVYQNIEDIVGGAREAGDAVTELGIGVITIISGSMTGGEPKKPDGGGDGNGNGKGKGNGNDKGKGDGNGNDKGDKDDKGDKKDDKGDKKGTDTPPKVPSVQFVVHAIQAGGDGVAKWSSAQLALQSNNVALAEAYQTLAGQNVLLAVAKVVQAQKELFVTSMRTLTTDCHVLQTNWSAMRDGLDVYKAAITEVSNEDTASKLAGLADAANKLWSVLQQKLARVKEQIMNAGFGG
jgi:hypothetical protein